MVSTVVRAFARQTTSYEQLLPTIARAIAEAIPDSCIVSLCNDDCTLLTVVAVHDHDAGVLAHLEQLRGTYRMAESPFAADAIAHGPLLLASVDAASIAARSPRFGELVRALDARGAALVPMRANGELIGLVTLLRRRADPALDELDLEIIEDLAGHAALAISNARLFARMRSDERTFLDAIVENIPDMVFVKEAKNLTFVRFNRAGEELLGTPRADLLGKNDHDLFPATEADFFTQKDRETLANKQLVEIPEEPIQTRSGTRWLHTKKVPLLDEDGTPRFLLGISHDITEKRRADAQLRAAKASVDNANKELEAFAYSVAHDLRTPLRGILGYSTAVLEDAGDKLDGQPRVYLERMRDAAERMATLIDQLLGLARVTQADLVRSRVDLTAVAHSVIGGFRHAEPSRTVDVAVQPGLVVDADPHLIATALENLLDNAWKFTAKRSDARIEVGREGGSFYVRDNGAGFDMAYAEQLFGVFRRLHAHDEFPGTGIGLATVARIIHRHHGRVWAESKPGEGATFYFTVGEAL